MDAISIEAAVELALREDLASGDLSTEALALGDRQAEAVAWAKAPLVVAGERVFFATFRRLYPSMTCESFVRDGHQVAAGSRVWAVRGPADAILMAERSALNLVQRMSGIATLTRRFVDALPAGSRTRITDTRKTTPGLRRLERYAVRMGGGFNHRDNLGSAVMLKDNHIAACGGITEAVERARRYAPHTATIEVEVESESMLEEALKAGADIIMLDNFDDARVAGAVERCRGRACVEVSGGITLERVAQLAGAGVDIISIGALTHSAPAADISLRITHQD